MQWRTSTTYRYAIYKQLGKIMLDQLDESFTFNELLHMWLSLISHDDIRTWCSESRKLLDALTFKIHLPYSRYFRFYKKKKKNSWQNCFALYFFELYAIYASAYFILELFWLAVKEVHTSISLTSILSLLPPLFPILSPPSSATLHTSSLYFPLTLFLSHLYSPSLSAVVSPCRSFYWLQRCCDGVLLTARTHSLW